MWRSISVATTAISMPTALHHVAAHGGARVAEPLEAEDEEDRGDEVGEVDEGAWLTAQSFRLNIPSMRCVTR